MSEETYIVLNPDDKEFVLKQLTKTYSALSVLYDVVKEDRAKRDLIDNVLGVSEYQLADLSKRLDYEGTLNKQIKERHAAIKAANVRIRELEKQLGSNRPLDGLEQQIKYLHDIVAEFWQSQGFGRYIKGFSVGPYGVLKLKLTFSIGKVGSSFSDTPVSDRKTHHEQIESLQNQGFELLMENNQDHEMKNSDTNKEKLINIIKTRFPSAIISRINAHSMGLNQDMYIRMIEVHIRNLTDLELS